MSIRSFGFFVSESLVADEVIFTTESLVETGVTFSIGEGSGVTFATEAITVTGVSFTVVQDVVVDFNVASVSIAGQSFVNTSKRIYPNSSFFIF